MGHLEKQKGTDYLVADVGLVQRFALEQFPAQPYYLLGHSMGSLVLRNFCIRKIQNWQVQSLWGRHWKRRPK